MTTQQSVSLLTRCPLAMLILGLLAAAGAGCSRQATQARYLSRANHDFETERYERAEFEYRAVLRIAPHNPVAIGRLGQIYYAEGRLPQAFACLQKAVELQPENADLRLKLGLTYMSVHKLKEAWGEAARVLQQQPANEEALILLADAASTNEIQQTLQRVESLPQPLKGGAGYHLARATLSFRQQDLDQAEAEFKQALARDPKSGAAYMGLGNLYLARRDLQRAEAALKSAAELAPLRSGRRLRYAEFKLQAGAAQVAKTSLEEITKGAPDYLPAWTMLAEIALAERRPEDCSALLAKILARDPANYDALMLAGNLLLVKGEGTNAVTHFERMATVYGREPMVQFRLALAYLLSRDMAKATASLSRAIAADPKFAEAVLLLAELNLRQGDSAPAVVSLTQLIKQQPQLAQAHRLLANAYLAQRNPDEALAVYRRMIDSFPKDPQGPFLMGFLLAQQNKSAEARQAFEKSLELSPDYLPALKLIVDLDLLDKQYARATERVKKEMERKPGAAEHWLLLAKIHWAQAMGYVSKEMDKTPGPARPKLRLADVPTAQHDVEQAEAALLKALELNPNLRETYLSLAQLYVASNKHQQALDRLTGLVVKTNDVAALMQIGMIHDELKHYAAAREAYERVLTVNPNSSLALNNLAYLYSERMGQLDKAHKMAEKARQLQPYDPYTADTLGWILYKRGEYIRALGLIQESALKLPAEPEVQFHVGMTHYMLGEEEPARLALQRAVAANKDFPDKAEGRRRLALLAIDAKTADAAARADLEKRLRETPDDPVALDRLAQIQEREGAFAKAASTYETALKQNPQNALILLRLAQLYSSRLSDPRKALRMARQAHTLAPADPRISYTLGRLVYQAEDYKWAASLLEESARKLPNDPGLLYDLAWSRYSLGRVAEAEAAMQGPAQAGAAFARAEEAKRFLATVAASENPAQAQQMAPQVQKLLLADPTYVPALMVSAIVQEQRGNYKEAAQFYDRILDRYPLFAPATRNLAFLCCERLGDDRKAYALAATARESFPADPHLARTLGILAYRFSDYARSAQLLEECAPRLNSDAELLYYLGMARYRLKEPAPSKAALQRALDLHVQTKLADEAKRVLAELK